MNSGVTLRELVVSGPEKRDAIVAFEPGLNVVAGPSDTGKTYIFECLDYVMGGSSRPKSIPEASGYETVRLSLQAHRGGDYSLTRSLRGGDIQLSSPDFEDRELKAKHSPGDPNTVSTFLLELSGFFSKRVRTNADGVTRAVSFRDIAHLAFVDEESVMTDRSPSRSGQNTDKTVESRILRLLLTGEDDSSVVAVESRKITRARQDERATILSTLIEHSRRDFDGNDRPTTIDAAEREVSRLKVLAAEASSSLTAIQETTTEVEKRRRSVWSDLRTHQSRADVLRELQSRFELLEDQYKSDLARLEAIGEVGLQIDETPEERCPVCGALAQHQQHEHGREEVSPAEIRTSCEAEAAKIATLILDLRETLDANGEELAESAVAAELRAAELREIDEELNDALRPQAADATREFRDAEARRERGDQALRLLRYEGELQELLGAKKEPVKRRKKLPSPKVSSGEAAGFAQQVEALLAAWHFPDLSRVTFSEEDQDLVIGERQRSSYGKGVRAITHAAFSLALLRYCADAKLPSPGVAVIDSPLVVYREPDPEEGAFPTAVKDFFYRSVAANFKDVQVLILENDAPPTALSEEANVITFTKATSGRYGFIPVT